MEKRENKILNYLNPKKQAIQEELNINVFEGRKRIAVDCKTVFMNAVLKSSELNDDELILTQKDLAWYFHTSEQSLYSYLERHSLRYNESDEYRMLSDYWNLKFCASDSVENIEYYRRLLIQLAKNNSERQCKKIINQLQEIGLISEVDTKITDEELKIAFNE